MFFRVKLNYIVLTAIVLLCWGFNSYATENFSYELSPSKDAAIVSAGLTLYGTSYYIDSKKKALTEEEINKLEKKNINDFDRSAVDNYSKKAAMTSDITLKALILSPVLLCVPYTNKNEWNKIFVLGVMFAEAYLVNNSINNFVKVTVGRKRPYLYNSNVSMNEKLSEGKNSKKSFYSGHTSSAFCSAVFVSTVYGDTYPGSNYKYVVYGTSLSIAALTGFLRYKAGKHFPSDILAGAAIGSFVGYIIPATHRKTNGQQISMIPILGNPRGLAISLKY